MPVKTKGSNQKSLNPADDMWSDKLAADLSRLETVGSSDEEKAVSRAKSWNPNSDIATELDDDEDQEDAAEAVRDKEKNGKPNWRTNVEKRRKASETAKMAARFLPGSKGSKWATGGIMGLLFGGVFGSGLVFMGPASLLVNLNTLATNHTNLGQHIYTRMGGSYFGAFLAGKNRDCAGSKIKCTFTKISAKKKADLEARGFKVESDPDMFGREKVRRITFTEGDRTTEIRTRNQFNNLKYTHFTAFAQMTRYPVMAAYLNPGAAIRHATDKFGIKLADKWRSSTAKEKDERQQTNRTSMNERTGATDDPQENRQRIKSSVESETEKATGGIKARLSSLKNNASTGGIATASAFAGCIAYDVMRATRAAITLKWHAELLKFAMPFIQVGSMIKEDDVDWQTVEALGDRIMKPITQADIDKSALEAAGEEGHVQVYTQDMLGKTAMDSKAFAAALHGDSQQLEGTSAGLYTAWNPVNSIIGVEVINKIEEYAPFGKDGIKLFCQGLTYATVALMRGCFKNPISGAGCLLSAFAGWALGAAFADDIIAWVTEKLTEPAVKAMANANLSADLHGPALGEATVTAAGVLGNYMDRASGFPVAADDGQAKQAFVDMYTDKNYMDGEIALKQHKAKQNQLDLNNEYSFASQFTSRFASIGWDGSIISILGNLGKVVSPQTLFEGTAKAFKGGLYQPVEIYSSEAKIQGALDNCTDPMLGEEAGINVSGLGESCHTVPVILEPVASCLKEEEEDHGEEGGRVCIIDAIDYLCKKTYKNEDDEQLPYIDCNFGKPSEFDQYSEGGEEEKDYDNPFMMYMQYCGRDRKYAPGYTDKPLAGSLLDDLNWSDLIASDPISQFTDTSSVEEFAAPIDDWHDFTNCVAGKWGGGALGGIAGALGAADQETFAWMAYYYTMCMSIAASEEGGIDYCWEEAPAQTTTPTPCGLSGSSPSLGSFSTGNGTRGTPRMIFVHTTEGDSIEGMASALRQHGTSYHIAIDESGKASRLVSDDQISNGTLGANTDALNIALVGFADKGDRLDANSLQNKTLAGCIKEWATKYSIPVEKVSGPGILNGGSTKGVAGHIDAAEAAGYSDRFDPGRRFPWDGVLANAK